MPSIPLTNEDLMRYADVLRTENDLMRQEIAQLRKDLKNHMELSERRFQEIYPCLVNQPTQTTQTLTTPTTPSSARVSPFMQPSLNTPSLSSSIFT